jgi:hypothetical protein
MRIRGHMKQRQKVRQLIAQGSLEELKVIGKIAFAARMVACCLASLVVLIPLASAAPPSTEDRLEPGLQGQTMQGEAGVLEQPYSKGVRVVGRTTLTNGRGGIMAWSGHCAYYPGDASVAVIDVQDPRAPKQVGLLTEKGAFGAGETIHASAGILAASTYGQYGPGARPGLADNDKAWLAVYDISDCAKPRLILEYKWPERVHTLTVSPNGNRIYGAVISPGDGHGGLQVLDISNPAAPRYLGKFGITRADGSSHEFAPHEVSISPDERRIYAGVIASRGGDLNQGVTTSFPSRETFGPEAGGIYILNNNDIASGRANPKMSLVGTAQHGGWHSAVQARIGGEPYLVGAGELNACPGAWPRITDITDEKNPRIVSHFKLQMNVEENCPPRDAMESASAGIVGRPGTATSHWNDVDNSAETRLGLFPFTWAGLRIVDLRDPTKPTEIAYFKPGDSCMSRARYDQATGNIWFVCQDSGFWVIALAPELRASLRLPKIRLRTVSR